MLTEADILHDLRELLAQRYGRLEIIITDGYIRTIHAQRTRQGMKPGAGAEPT